jgi:hypothetical protein
MTYFLVVEVEEGNVNTSGVNTVTSVVNVQSTNTRQHEHGVRRTR